MKISESKQNLVFDYRTLRLIVGGIALLFPWVVIVLAGTITSSISASYHTNARDVFVGLLFVIGMLLVAYKGHKLDLNQGYKGPFSKLVDRFRKWEIHFGIREEHWVSTVGGFGAIAAALFPTACDSCKHDLNSRIHAVAGTVLFSTVVYFCLVAFRGQVTAKIEAEEKEKSNNTLAEGEIERLNALQTTQKRRARLYLICGLGIAAVMLWSVVAPYLGVGVSNGVSHVTFFAEAVALVLFGVAWLTASQMLPFLAQASERK